MRLCQPGHSPRSLANIPNLQSGNAVRCENKSNLTPHFERVQHAQQVASVLTTFETKCSISGTSDDRLAAWSARCRSWSLPRWNSTSEKTVNKNTGFRTSSDLSEMVRKSGRSLGQHHVFHDRQRIVLWLTKSEEKILYVPLYNPKEQKSRSRLLRVEFALGVRTAEEIISPSFRSRSKTPNR